MSEDEKCPATIALSSPRTLWRCALGDGWWYWAEEYPDEGIVGPFGTAEEAMAHGEAADYGFDADQLTEIRINIERRAWRE